KDSAEMKKIIARMEDLNNFIVGTTLEKDNAEAFKEKGNELLKSIKSLAEMTENYVNTKNPWFAEGKARLKIVKQINDRLQRDIIGMEEKINDFQYLPEDEKARINSWTDFLNFQRTVHLVDGKNGVKISNTGGNTSDVIVIEKNGQKFFFKEEEKLPSDDFGTIMKNVTKDAKKDRGDKPVEKGSVESYVDEFLKCFNKEISRFDTNELFAGLLSGGKAENSYKGIKESLKTFGIMFSSQTGQLVYDIDKLSDEKKKKEIQDKLGQIFNDIRKDFVMGEIGAHTTKIKAGEEMAKRNVATARLANLLGLGDVVPTSEMATIEVNGEKKYGVIMGEAEGQETSKVIMGKNKEEHKDKLITYTGNAIKDSLNLQVLDILCGQTDRHSGNRMSKIVETKKKGVYAISKVTGIDGDLSFGTRDYETLKVEDQTGFGLPAMSEDVAERILALDPAILDYEMLGLLNKKERKALKERLQGMQAAIKKRKEYEKKNPTKAKRFLKDEEWDAFTTVLRDKAKKSTSLLKSLGKTYITPSILLGMKMK
ncbi:MAG: hypothetical protein IIZ61_05215, partial [Lachnospiraceae bacterium]|nr:hypothetical protein [Lachnospiraceae bacterium]